MTFKQRRSEIVQNKLLSYDNLLQNLKFNCKKVPRCLKIYVECDEGYRFIKEDGNL